MADTKEQFYLDFCFFYKNYTKWAYYTIYTNL